MIKYTGYVDGSFISTMPYKIGYSFILLNNQVTKILCSDYFVSNTMLNSAIAEVFGLMFFLNSINAQSIQNDIVIYSDSQYVTEVYNQNKSFIAYPELWKAIHHLKRININITVQWSKKDNHGRYHKLCDSMAKMSCYDNFQINFYT